MIIRLPSKDDELERLYEVFDELLLELGFDDQEQVTVGYSFREAVGNAFEHGNGKDESKIIHLLYMVDHEKMCIAVTDEGDGFDHVTYVAEKSQESAYATTTGRSEDIRPGGLGFHMMRKAYDKITYNDSGNTIYLMKFLPWSPSRELTASRTLQIKTGPARGSDPENRLRSLSEPTKQRAP
jgi:anti-sigma regulatory factor (Ser/Thr protein kinase)